MNVTELIDDLAGRFPSFNRRWETDYRAALGDRTGPDLAVAWQRTMASWRKRGWPRPADIVANMPARIGAPTMEFDNGEGYRPRFGPPYGTPERELWDKAWKHARGLPMVWPPGDQQKAEYLGYVAFHRKTMSAAWRRPEEGERIKDWPPQEALNV